MWIGANVDWGGARVAFLPWRRWNKWLVRKATERYTPSSLEKEFKLAI